MYDKIRDEITQDYYTQNFSNEGQRYVAWYLRNIYLRNLVQTRDDIVDNPGDRKIDAIFIDDVNSAIRVIQGKFIGAPSIDSQPLQEVLAAWVQLRDIKRLQEVGNEKLQRKLSEVSKALDDDYELSFELITTSSLTQAADEDLATFQKQLATMSEKDDIDATLNIVDQSELRRRYDMALDRENPLITHTFPLEEGKYLLTNIAGTSVAIVAVPLKTCIEIPGVKDGTLFQKNVRQSLGANNVVNKGIRNTIYSDKHRDFFFFHNGITAICNKMRLEDRKLHAQGLSVVNGCQSLNTILSCSEQIKTFDDTYVMFRFYEIPQRDRADKISVSTNSQSAVKPRDLRSNDKRVLNLKKLFEQKYATGFLLTKRGEVRPADKDARYVLDMADLAKFLISWHSQRPNIAYNENKLFDKYFEQLFKREYRPENVQSLNLWYHEIMKYWTAENPLRLNETLLAMKAYAPYHQLYAISMCFAIQSNQQDRVPNPTICHEAAVNNNMVSEIAKVAGTCLTMALEAASKEPQPQNRVFSPQNWIKAKVCLTNINFAIRNYFNMLPMMPGGAEISKKFAETLTLPVDNFEYRWEAD